MGKTVTPSNPADLLDVQQTASELGLATRTVLHHIASGKIAAAKIGVGRTSAYVITRAELERFRSERAA